jgi:hypothetical protein
MRFAGRYHNTVIKNSLDEVLLEGTITPSKSTPLMRFAGRYYNTLKKYSLYEVCWKLQ